MSRPRLGATMLCGRGARSTVVADITYVPSWTGFLYLAVVIDAFSRRVVGWAMQTHLRSELVLQALEMANAQRRPGEVIHRSDSKNIPAGYSWTARPSQR